MDQPGLYYPRSTIDSEPYWEACRREELLYQHCNDCGETVFHPRAACPYCLSDRLEWRRSSGNGEIYSFAIQYVPLDRKNPGKLPRTLGIIALDEGYHMFSQIDSTDPERLRIGAKVTVYFDRLAEDLVLPKFRLTAAE